MRERERERRGLEAEAKEGVGCGVGREEVAAEESSSLLWRVLNTRPCVLPYQEGNIRASEGRREAGGQVQGRRW